MAFFSIILVVSMVYVFLPAVPPENAGTVQPVPAKGAPLAGASLAEASLAGAVPGETPPGDPPLAGAYTGSLGGSAESAETVSGAAGRDPQARMLLYVPYTVVKGDIIGEIAKTFGLYEDTIISVNGIRNSRLLQIGQVLKIPNQDGILYKAKPGETLNDIAAQYNIEPLSIQTANELFSQTLNSGGTLFIPGTRLDWVSLQEINGDLFIWPVRSYVTSNYGYRRSPFTGTRQFHTGLDIGAVLGTPIAAAMSGRVSATGFDATLGNYVVITHHSGYRTLYGHMNLIRTKPGAYVRTGERIGDVGSTGLSTGPHLHFMVYKNGVTVNPRTLMK
jgi:murein DD-endopeptidase MepM/ murein hydrolase activator NlpD